VHACRRVFKRTCKRYSQFSNGTLKGRQALEEGRDVRSAVPRLQPRNAGRGNFNVPLDAARMGVSQPGWGGARNM
jgi:hypothetical protein